MPDVWKLALSALFGVMVGLAVQWWKSYRDETRILCEEFCSCIDEAADISSQYWHVSGKSSKSKILEARILGLQARLDGYRVLVGKKFARLEIESLNEKVADLFDAATGHTFKTENRLSDSDRAIRVQTCASELILQIRTSFERTTSVAGTVERFLLG